MLKEYTDENDSPEDIELLILLLQKVLLKNLLQPTGKSFYPKQKSFFKSNFSRNWRLSWCDETWYLHPEQSPPNNLPDPREVPVDLSVLLQDVEHFRGVCGGVRQRAPQYPQRADELHALHRSNRVDFLCIGRYSELVLGGFGDDWPFNLLRYGRREHVYHANCAAVCEAALWDYFHAGFATRKQVGMLWSDLCFKVGSSK